MNEFEQGFSYSPLDEQDAINKLIKYFHKNKYLQIDKLYFNCKNLGSFSVYDFKSNPYYSRTVINSYLNFLTKTKILSKKRKKQNIFTYNAHIEEWKIPNIHDSTKNSS